MAKRERQNRAAQPKKTRGVIDITKQGTVADTHVAYPPM